MTKRDNVNLDGKVTFKPRPSYLLVAYKLVHDSDPSIRSQMLARHDGRYYRKDVVDGIITSLSERIEVLESQRNG